jgi:hypothetical protein
MNLTVQVDPTDPVDVRQGITALERLLGDTAPEPDLAKIVGAVASNTYGAGRLGYLAEVAAAGDDGAPVSDLMSNHFGGRHQSFGGTHAAIERTWRARGGAAIAPRLIDDNADGTRQVMTPEARPLVLACIDLQSIRRELLESVSEDDWERARSGFGDPELANE